MNAEKLTQKSLETLREANEIASKHQNQLMEQQHLLYALIDENDDMISEILIKMRVKYEALVKDVEIEIDKLPKIMSASTPIDNMYMQNDVDVVMNQAEQIANNMKDDYVSVEHIMLALIQKSNDKIKYILNKYNISENNFMKELQRYRGNSRVSSKNPESTFNVLERYGVDLVKQAAENKLDPVIGREEEIRNLIRILSRKTKNNPVLIGEPGVGKTAIVEGLALRILKGDVPNNLKDRRIFSLDISAVIAGAKFKGEFEERMKAVLNEIVKSNGKIILFIDELHIVVGAGKSDGALDAGNMLKPMLARGELHCIGATTINEYREYIESDAALERRFQPINVHEPDVESTISILRGLKERYELFHGVKIMDRAIIAAAKLSDRYITDRFLPDKAIDLIDEACATIKMEMNSMPIELDDISRKIMQLEIEEAALSKETDEMIEDEATLKRLQVIREELDTNREKFNKMKSDWKYEKEKLDKVQKIRNQIDAVNAQIDAAEREYDLNKAAELKYSTLPDLKSKLEKEEKRVEQNEGKGLLRNKVTEEEITKIIGRWTGIPVSRILESEKNKLLNLEEVLHKRVVGQDEAVRKVSEAILRSRAGIANPNRPIGSFLFLGPTGVGKTELAKTLAESLFDAEKNMVRIDMSEYMERYSVSRLIGAPPGYVGYEEGGQLTDAVRTNPYTVVLFDEVEKAHPDVFNILLQILDDGRITDSQGRTVNFKNTIIIMTSNLGAQYILDGIENGEISQDAQDKVQQLLKKTFRPELLNRLDDIIMFKPLMKDQIYKIVDIQIDELRKLLKDKELEVEITDRAKKVIIEESYNPYYGARPIKRYMQGEIETMVAKQIIASDVNPGDTIKIDYDGVDLVTLVKKGKKNVTDEDIADYQYTE